MICWNIPQMGILCLLLLKFFFRFFKQRGTKGLPVGETVDEKVTNCP